MDGVHGIQRARRHNPGHDHDRTGEGVADSAPVHDGGRRSVRLRRVGQADSPASPIRTARSSSRWTTPRFRPAGRRSPPTSWSRKYFRKAGVPQTDDDGQPLARRDGKPVLGPERSARQVIHRLAGCWRHWGESHGYFASAEDAQAFYDELRYMLVNQMAAPNSPQWFNTGLAWAYGITGPAQGHYYVDPADGEIKESADAYTRPQPHACFIQSVNDDLVDEGGIMDLWVREARLFKYGSGTGTNFSDDPRRGRDALRRRHILRPDELPQGRRPRRRRDQERRHHPPRGQDGRPRRRPPRHRAVHQLEGATRRRRSPRLIAGGLPRADFNGEAYADRLRPELQQLRARHRTTSSKARREATTTGICAGAPTARSARPSRPATSGSRSPRPPGSAPIPASSSTRRSTSGTPARRRADQRQQPVLRVHVPRQHRLQPGQSQPDQVRRRRDRRRSMSRPTGTRSGSGRSCSRSAS